jgi:hypothetical protein
MRIGRRAAIMVAASTALLALGAQAFAASGSIHAATPLAGAPNGSSGSCPFEVTAVQVVGSPKFPLKSLNLDITVEQTGQTTAPGPYYFPDPNYVKSTSQQLLPEIDISGSGIPPGFNGIPPTELLSPNPPVSPSRAGTAEYVFTLRPPLPPGQYTVSLATSGPSGHVFHMFNSPRNQSGPTSGTAPVCLATPPPTGQLPEVPFAAAIPLVGLGVGAVLWYRRRQVA